MSGQKKGKEAVLFPGERLDDLQLNGLGLYRYCCLKRRRDVILQVWRFSRRWQRWLEEV
mgnify:CR=1 FL=1